MTVTTNSSAALKWKTLADQRCRQGEAQRRRDGSAPRGQSPATQLGDALRSRDGREVRRYASRHVPHLSCDAVSVPPVSLDASASA
jgi:hypothetical protein